MTDAQGTIVTVLALSLRIAPTFAFAPPFTLLRTPMSIRLLLSIGLAYCLAQVNPARIDPSDAAPAMVAELLLGITLAITLQLAFAALLTVGRALDIQVGFGLAQLADPSLQAQMPLIGTLFSYAAGAVFFMTDGPLDLLAIWSRSIEIIPPGGFDGRADISVLLGYLRVALTLAIGFAGAVFLTLFLVDLAVAFMSRTLPQMNVLVLGFQVKTITLLLTLPFVFAFGGAALFRLLRLAVEAAPRLI